MDERTFFLKAMQADEYRRRAWVISAFSLIREGMEAWKKDPYPYRIDQTPSGHFFVDPEKGLALTLIEDADPKEPPLKIKDHIELKEGELPNVYSDVKTTYGNVLVNYTAIVWPFGKKVEFLVRRVDAGKLEAYVIKRLADDLKPGDPVPKTVDRVAQIYVSE